MRQVFSSQRLENVEGVADLLREAGIEVRITNGRSYRGGRRGTFSYGDASASPKPAVWVVRSDDQIRAREILREAGLIDSTRHGNSFVNATFRSDTPETVAANARQRRTLRIKYGLLAVILVVVGFMVVHMIRTPPVQPLAAPPFDGSARDMPPAVARAVFVDQLPDPRIDVVCLSMDGVDAPVPMVESLQDLSGTVVAASACERIPDEERGSIHRTSGEPALMVDVTAFRPSAADTAQVEYTAYHHRMFGTYRTLEVKRVDDAWQVTKVLRSVSM